MQACKHLKDGHCTVASEICGKSVPVTDRHCEFCTLHGEPPQAVNGITVSLGFAALNASGADTREFMRKYGHHTHERQEGPGSELHAMISWIFTSDTPCGRCNRRVRKMNRWGTEKCRRRKRLIAAWLRQSANENGIPLPGVIAETLVEIAISRAEKKQTDLKG